MGGPALLLDRDVRGELGGRRGGQVLGLLEGLEGGRGGPARLPRAPCPPLPPSPAAACQRAAEDGHEGLGELVAGARAGCHLLGLRGQAPDLRAQLGEDVLDPGEVVRRLGELLLRAAAAPFVAAHAGHLLEERPALLGSQREGLVDHPLADEQERVVGEVGGVEQLDEVLQAHPLAVDEVVVLARAEEAAAHLEDGEVDGDQAVGVVEDEDDVRHAQRGTPLRPGEDDILGAPGAERPALLSERPAERIGEVALAGTVGTDDGVDAGNELDDGPLGERLEALETERLETRRAAHGAGSSSRAVAGRRARSGRAAVDAVRRSVGRQRLERRGGGGRLRGPARGAAARAGDAPAHRHLDAEAPLVIGPRDLHEAVLGTLAGPALRQLLEPALGALEGSRRGLRGQLGRGEAGEPGPRRAPAPVEEDGGGDGLQRGGEQDRPGAAAALRFPLAQEQVLAELHPTGQPRQPGGADDGSAAGRQDALVVARTEGVERLAR